MLIGFLPIFVGDPKIIYGYNFVVPLKMQSLNIILEEVILNYIYHDHIKLVRIRSLHIDVMPMKKHVSLSFAQ